MKLHTRFLVAVSPGNAVGRHSCSREVRRRIRLPPVVPSALQCHSPTQHNMVMTRDGVKDRLSPIAMSMMVAAGGSPFGSLCPVTALGMGLFWITT